MKKFDDIRNLPFLDNKDFVFEDVNVDFIKTLTFNERSSFPKELEQIKNDIIDKGKNPGFGVKNIHNSGIVGNNVNVAIIDQPLMVDHPEYNGKIIAYKNFDEDNLNKGSSMHGPAVTSLLVGNNIGTAPGAKVVYASIPTWKANQKYAIDAIDWIIEVNNTLPKNEKIRVISISASPPSWNYKNDNMWVKNEEEFRDNLIEWEKAEKKALDNNILIISCVQNKYMLSSCYYDIDSPDDFSLVRVGFPNFDTEIDNCLLIPTSLRTVAECYEDGIKSYCYYGDGGLSWGIPYLCGCLAMAWQINPNIKADEMMTYVFESAIKKDGFSIINPQNFIQKIIDLTNNNNITIQDKSI